MWLVPSPQSMHHGVPRLRGGCSSIWPLTQKRSQPERLTLLPLPALEVPSSVWPYVRVEFVQVVLLDGQLTVEIGYRVAWDEEHTLGARIRGGQLVGPERSVASAK